MQDGLALPDRTPTSRAELEDHRHLGAVPDAPTGCSPPARSRSWSPRPTPVHRHAVGQPPRVRRPVAAGRLGARLARRPDDRVLALAHAALRHGDLLGRRPAAQRPARPHVRGARPARRRIRDRRRARRRPRPRTPTSRWSTRRRASGSCRSTRRCATPDGGPDAAAYHGIFDPFYRGAFDAGPPGAHRPRPPAARPERRAGRPDAGGGRATHPVLVVAGALRRRRRDARLARRLRRTPAATWCSARAPATPTTRPAPATSRRPHGSPRPPASGTTSSATSCATSRSVPRPGGPLDLPERRDGDPLGRRPHRRRRRCARRVRPPALRPLAGRHHPPPRRRPGHLRRHGTRTRPRPGAGRMAGAGAAGRLAPPPGLRHRHDRHLPGRAPGPRRAQLELGARRGRGAGAA